MADETVSFGSFLEVAVVVHALIGAVLHMEYGVIEHVAHLMEEGADGELNGAIQHTGTDVDFPLALALHRPGGVQSVVTVGTGSGPDGDDGGIQSVVEEVAVQHGEELLQLTGETTGFRDFFHGFTDLNLLDYY